MKPSGIVGILLIVIGLAIFAYGGIHWTEHKQDAKLGPLEISHNEEHGVSFPPIAGGLCVVGGIVLLAVGGRK